MDRNIEYNIEGYVPGLQFTEYVFDIVHFIKQVVFHHKPIVMGIEHLNFTIIQGFFYDEIKKFITL